MRTLCEALLGISIDLTQASGCWPRIGQASSSWSCKTTPRLFRHRQVPRSIRLPLLLPDKIGSGTGHMREAVDCERPATTLVCRFTALALGRSSGGLVVSPVSPHSARERADDETAVALPEIGPK
jgi:hypothetical protein